MWIFLAIGIAFVALVHTAPAPLLLDALAGDRAVWHMPRGDPPTVYLTFDDGPNPSTTPELLDALAREQVHATFFLIDEHVTGETAPIIRRMFADGHAVALHSGHRWDLLKTTSAMAQMLRAHADRIEQLAGARPCRAFRPHGGWRSESMYTALGQLDYRLVGWGWMLWDFNFWRRPNPETVVRRFVARVRGGDIVVMHDGDERAPRKPQPQTIEAAARLIPQLRARGFSFGKICE